MKQRNTIATILLNILFCATLLWFFSRNAYLRPYLGSPYKEALSGLLLLVTLYANYFIFFPKLYRQRTSIYWFAVITACFLSVCVELASGYTYISENHAAIIAEIGSSRYFFKHLILIFSRNLAFNFFPYMLRVNKQLMQSLETEVRAVYQYARMIDVCDREYNCHHIPVDDIFYCMKRGNETEVYTVDGVKYTRNCTIRYLIQLLGDKDFVRISPSIVVPFQHIASCDGKALVMKTMPWTEAPLKFELDTRNFPQARTAIEEYLHAKQEGVNDKWSDDDEEKGKISLSVPPKEKLDTVLDYIKEHPGCRSMELISHTSYSQTTMDRCLSELKKQGLIEHVGSKKNGGYQVAGAPPEDETNDLVQHRQSVSESF